MLVLLRFLWKPRYSGTVTAATWYYWVGLMVTKLQFGGSIPPICGEVGMYYLASLRTVYVYEPMIHQQAFEATWVANLVAAGRQLV